MISSRQDCIVSMMIIMIILMKVLITIEESADNKKMLRSYATANRISVNPLLMRHASEHVMLIPSCVHTNSKTKLNLIHPPIGHSSIFVVGLEHNSRINDCQVSAVIGTEAQIPVGCRDIMITFSFNAWLSIIKERFWSEDEIRNPYFVFCCDCMFLHSCWWVSVYFSW